MRPTSDWKSKLAELSNLARQIKAERARLEQQTKTNSRPDWYYSPDRQTIRRKKEQL